MYIDSSFPSESSAYPFYHAASDCWYSLEGFDTEDGHPILSRIYFDPAGGSDFDLADLL